MEKEALIDIILNDIKEVHALVNTFKGKQELNVAFINLTRTKIANINEELSLLEQLNVKKVSTDTSESSLTSTVTAASVQDDITAIAESSSRFAEGESNINGKNETIESKATELTTSTLEGNAKHSDSDSKAFTGDTKAVAGITKPSHTDSMAVADDTKHSDSESMTGESGAKPVKPESKSVAEDTEHIKTDSLTAERATKPADTESMTVTSNTKHSANETSASVTDSGQPETENPKANTLPENGQKRSFRHQSVSKNENRKSVLGEVINQETSSVNDKL
ncbi:MAG: hypothetical protein MI866_06085, partial [Bacteroidales bacterium]|nr:hypothetical protein [Bacteroidales bacterium]